MVRKLSVITIAIAAACMVSACDHAKSTAQVASDTNAAEQKAADDSAKVQQRADARIASARDDVHSQQQDLAHVDAVQGQKVADSRAEGDYKVALAQCEGLSGAVQKSCKDQANADYDVARAKAKQARAENDPKP
jgi:hypothetical protein